MGDLAMLFECLEDLPPLLPIPFISRSAICEEERLNGLGSNAETPESVHAMLQPKRISHRRMFRPSIRTDPLSTS